MGGEGENKNMIVNYQEKGWQVITQRSHGIVAAQLAFNWKFKEYPRHWVEILMSIAEHDDAENELDGETLLTDAGGPLNYDMKTFDLEHCRRLSSLTIAKSRTIALLTSLHMEFLYASAKSETAEATKFLAEQKKLRAQWMKELGITENQAMDTYNLLEWCDAFSLLICKDEMQEEQRSTEISTGPDKTTYYLKKLDDDTLTVEPWPFSSNGFTVSYETRELSQLVFKSSEEFRTKFLAAEVIEKTWNITKAVTKGAGEKAKGKVKDK